MRTIKEKIFVFFLFSGTFAGFAQNGQLKMRWIYGNFDVLKNEMAVKLSFNFDSMRVGKYATEQEYIAEMKRKFDKSDSGRGAEWEKEWFESRAGTYIPRFGELFFKHARLDPDPELARYTLIFKTTRIEPGWHAGVMNLPSYIDGETWLVKNGEPETVIAKLSIVNVPGEKTHNDYTARQRIGESYALAGKKIAKYIASLKKVD